MPTGAAARSWLERWDRQQEASVADREERFAVIGDVLALAVGRPDPLLVDLGCGPGSLSVRLLDRFPAASVVAVDADPVLLGLGRAAYGDHPGLRFVEHDLRRPGWIGALGLLPRPPDAVVSTTALHWLTRDELEGVYADCGRLLGPTGVVVNGDHFADSPDTPRLAALGEPLAGARLARGARSDRADRRDLEDWERWWAAVGAAPELADLTAGRDVRPVPHAFAEPPSIADHADLLRAAGFAEVGTVWQCGDDRVLVALR